MTHPLSPLPASIQGQGLPIVLLHAFPVDSRMWLPQAHSLSNSYRLIVPDQRGFGEARALAAGQVEVTVGQAADDIAQLLTAHHIDKAVIGGISRGGYIALAFARRHPERLLALMLFDTRANPADEKERQTYEAVADRLSTGDIGFLPEDMKPRIFGPTALAKRQPLIEQVKSWILDQDPQAAAAAARGMVNRPDARPALTSIQVPVLAVAGTEDAAFQNTKAIAAAIPNAQFVEVPEAGHLCPLERPEIVAEIMRDFLKNSVGKMAKTSAVATEQPL